MSRRTYSYNAFTGALASPIASGSASITLDSTTGLQAPCYLVIEPDSTTKREYIKVLAISAPTLQTVTRGLAGSVAGAQAHDAGVEVRAVMVHQIIDDIFQDIIDLESGFSGHDGGFDTADHPEATSSSRGFMSSAAFNKLAGIEASAQVNPTANEILNLLLGVDGSGSQLDADTLDGYHAADLAGGLVQGFDDYISGGEVTLTNGVWVDSGASLQLSIPGGWDTFQVMAWGTASVRTNLTASGWAYVGSQMKIAGTTVGSRVSAAQSYALQGLSVPAFGILSGLSGSTVTITMEFKAAIENYLMKASAIQAIATPTGISV